MKQILFLILASFLLLTVSACKQAKKKAKDAVTHVGEKIIEEIYPPFDEGTPDTDNNKARFKEFLKVELTPDIKNIYCHNDDIGIDLDFMFAFECKEGTAEKIIQKHKLELNGPNIGNASGLRDDFPWWDEDRIRELPRYSWFDGKSYYKYFWYDRETGKAWYFDFDM